MVHSSFCIKFSSTKLFFLCFLSKILSLKNSKIKQNSCFRVAEMVDPNKFCGFEPGLCWSGHTSHLALNGAHTGSAFLHFCHRDTCKIHKLTKQCRGSTEGGSSLLKILLKKLLHYQFFF